MHWPDLCPLVLLGVKLGWDLAFSLDVGGLGVSVGMLLKVMVW